MERRVVETLDRSEWVDAFDEERLVPPDVADPRERALVQERLGDGDVRARRITKSPDCLVLVGLREVWAQQVGPQRRDRWMEALSALLEQLHDRRVEADRNRPRDLDHESRPPFRSPPALAGPIA